MRYLTEGLINAADSYSFMTPYWEEATAIKWLVKAMKIRRMVKKALPVIKGEQSLGTAVGNHLAGKVIHKTAGKIFNKAVAKVQEETVSNTSHLIDPKRSWFNERGNIDITIVYHDAYKAQKHLDIHFGNGTSFIIRVSGKPVESKIKYNNKGELTQASKDALIEHIRNEVAGRSRLPQNLDHNPDEAKISWAYGDGPKEGYGSGETRQVILQTKGTIFKISDKKGQTAEMWIPAIDPNKSMYIHKLYNGDEKRAPIAVWGFLKSEAPKKLEDRLHLKMISPDEFDKFKEKTDAATTTRKYDGASCYIVVGKRTTVWSPRISKETGERIEYTPKVWEIADMQHSSKPIAMGELLFKKNGRYLKAHEIGGILNSNQVRPDDVVPEIRLYRVDKWKGKDVHNLPFFKNRELQLKMAQKSSILDVVDLVPQEIIKSWEGLVAVPKGLSINEGYKIKWFQDPDDWKVKKVDLAISEKGNIKGVVWFESLTSGKEFKLGPGQIGSFDANMDIINNPHLYEGRVAKVISRNGHEGRAAKLVEWHLDK
jgi:hypothetical protein